MKNLYTNFEIEYFNFNGTVYKEANNIITLNLLKYNIIINIPIFKFKKVFDDFYGCKILEQEDFIKLQNIPIRILYFKEFESEKVIAIGHVQNDIWICNLQSEVFKKEDITKKYVEMYLSKIIQKFPRSINEFLEALNSNSYEICKMLNLNEVSPLDFENIFKEIFIKISKSYV